MDKLRIGIIGLGRGFSLFKVFNIIDGCMITAICDMYELKMRSSLTALASEYKQMWNPPVTSEQLEKIKCYTDYRKFLEDPNIDAVCLAVGPHENADLICESLEAGKHVICEVPLAFTIEDCQRIITAVEKSGLKFSLAEQHRYAPYCQAMRKIVREEKRIGKVVFAEGHYFHGLGKTNYWVDGNTGYRISIENAKNHPNPVKSRFWHMNHPIYYLPHTLSPITMILDDRITKVTCLGTKPKSYYYEDFDRSDIEVALMQTEKDTVIRVATSFTFDTTAPHHWFNFMGIKGRIETRRFKNEKDKIWLTENFMDAPAEVDWCWTGYDSTSVQRTTGHGGMDYFPLADFVNSFHENRDPFFDVYMAADNAAPAILAGKSAEEGGTPFDVPVFSKKHKI